MNEKKFTSKQVYIIVFAIVASFAFLETSHPVWTGEFLREFFSKLFVYGLVTEFIVILLADFLNKD